MLTILKKKKTKNKIYQAFLQNDLSAFLVLPPYFI